MDNGYSHEEIALEAINQARSRYKSDFAVEREIAAMQFQWAQAEALLAIARELKRANDGEE